MSFWGELLWFEQLGLTGRFWRVLLARILVGSGSAVAAAAIVLVATWPVRRSAPLARWIGAGLTGIVGGISGALAWDTVYRWAFGIDVGVREPVFGADVGFYLFTLPFVDYVLGLAFTSAVASIVIAAWAVVAPSILAAARREVRVDAIDANLRRGVYVAFAAACFVLAASRVASAFHLLYAHNGVVHGPGWTDVHVRLPAYFVTAAALLLVGIVLAVPRLTTALEERVLQRLAEKGRTPARGLSLTGAVMLLPASVAVTIGLAGSVVLPGLFQWLRVGPNELALERPYIENNIPFIRPLGSILPRRRDTTSW